MIISNMIRIPTICSGLYPKNKPFNSIRAAMIHLVDQILTRSNLLQEWRFNNLNHFSCTFSFIITLHHFTQMTLFQYISQFYRFISISSGKQLAPLFRKNILYPTKRNPNQATLGIDLNIEKVLVVELVE